jgi:predicted NUDIX family NTP pyrophosphohydrolase
VQQGWCLRRAKQSAVGVARAAQEAEEEAEEFVEADEEEEEEDAEAAAAEEEEEEEEIEYVDDADVDLDEVRLRGGAVALHWPHVAVTCLACHAAQPSRPAPLQWLRGQEAVDQPSLQAAEHAVSGQSA